MIYDLKLNTTTDLVKLAKGNTKLGKKVWTVNLLPGDEPIYINTRKDILTDIKGTCTGVCDGCEHYCYAVRDFKLHHNAVTKCWGINTLIMRYSLTKYFNDISAQIIKNKIELFRFHSAGEIESYEYLLGMVDLANKFKKVHFYFYTKRFDLMSKFIKEGNILPDNLVCNLSEWKDNLKGYPELSGLNKFVWDDGTDESLKSVYHCPAVLNHNIKCGDCKGCWKKNTGRRIAVYDHSGRKIIKEGK